MFNRKLSTIFFFFGLLRELMINVQLGKCVADTLGVVIPLATWKPEDTNIFVEEASASQKLCS